MMSIMLEPTCFKIETELFCNGTQVLKQMCLEHTTSYVGSVAEPLPTVKREAKERERERERER